MFEKTDYLSSASSILRKLKPTEVFDAYWYFAAERQRIFQLRRNNHPGPWTNDRILQTYKFTNAYRLLDRVSQFLIRNVIGSGEYKPNDLFFRIILFKLFNKIETWELLEGKLGEITWQSYDFKRYDCILSNALMDGQKIYSAAYIMPSGLSAFGSKRKHRNHLYLLELMMKTGLPSKISNSRSMHEAYNLLISYPTIGKFLSYQLITDINYSELTDFKETEFVIAGPGACEGIRKSFENFENITPEEVVRIVTDFQNEEFEERGLCFDRIPQRPLQYIDCQNLFCEIDKYSRVAFPMLKGKTGRVKIKQKFKQNNKPIQYMLPPKWGGALTNRSKEKNALT
ncbi:MAG: putative DNA base hypermodification protein [Chromatiales bacterium]